MKTSISCLLVVAALSACQNRPLQPESFSYLPSFATTNRSVSAVRNPYLKSINTEDEFNELGSPADGIIQGGKIVKFLIDNRSYGTDTPATPYFLNSKQHRLHYDFARAALKVTAQVEAFNSMTYFTRGLKNKKFIAGTVQQYERLERSKIVRFYGIQFYPQDFITEDEILYAVRLLKEQLKMPSVEIAVVSYGEQQSLAKITKDLERLGVTPLTIEQLLGDTPLIVMNQGVAHGVIRFFPATRGRTLADLDGRSPELLDPWDIPVFTELPLDLSVVAAVLTIEVQTAVSHINLKSKERGTPNVVIRSPDLVKKFRSLHGVPVALTVKQGRVEAEILPGDGLATVKQMYVDGLKRKWVSLPANSAKTIMNFDKMCPADTAQCLRLHDTYGGKAAKLGFLANKTVLGRQGRLFSKFAVKNSFYPQGLRLTPAGLGVSLGFYQSFVSNNPKLQKKINDLTKKEKSKLPPSSEERLAMVEDIQKEFYQSLFTDTDWKQVRAAVEGFEKAFTSEIPGVEFKKLKIRSSANVEDMPNFDGAGLHASYSAKLKEGLEQTPRCQEKADPNGDGVETKSIMEPESLSCAIKGVFASLWNKRAIEERSHARLDHETAAMGLAISPSYGSYKIDAAPKQQQLEEQANTVVVTRVLNTESVYGYTIAAQTGDGLVTNPTPQTQSESVLATFLGDEAPGISILQLAKPFPDRPALNESIFKDKNREIYTTMVDMVRHAEIKYCEAKKKLDRKFYGGDCSYIPADTEKTALDLEFKVLADPDFGVYQVFCKQIREFSAK